MLSSVAAYWALGYVVSEWTLRLVMMIVITRRRRPPRPPSVQLSWLMLIFFLPWIGLGFYLLFGDYRLPRKRMFAHAQILEQIRAARGKSQKIDETLRITRESLELEPELPDHLRTVITLAENLGDMPIFGGNTVETIGDQHQIISRIIADIDMAKNHVHMLYYIFADDETGQRVAEALKRASARGVSCRILLDSVGSRKTFRRLVPDLVAHGAAVGELLPVGLFRRAAARMDLRNHRKMVVIDGRIGYTGSQNIVDPGYGNKHLLYVDLMARVTGPAVAQFQVVFLQDWACEMDEIHPLSIDTPGLFDHMEPTGRSLIQVLPSGPNYDVENYQRWVIAALHSAQHRVIITTPYFIPDEAMMQALQTIILRDVQVDLIVPSSSDQYLVGWAQRAYYHDALEAGIRVHLYRPGLLLHSKTITIDDEIALIGSSNFDVRSFALNYEISLLCYGPEAAARLRVRQEAYMRDCITLQSADLEKISFPQNLVHNVARLFSPLL